MSQTEVTLAEPDRFQVSLDPWIVVALLWPLGRIVELQIVGTVYLQDAMSVGILLLLVMRPGSVARLQQIRWVFFLGLLWLLGQIFTDIWRGSAFEDFGRGWAKIVFFIATLAAMWLFLPIRRSYLAAYAAGMALAAYAAVPAADTAFGAEGVRWRFGLGEAMIVASAVLVSGAIPGTRRLTRFAPIVLAAVAAFQLAVQARSNFGNVIAAAALCQLYVILARNPALRRTIRPSTFVVGFMAALVATQGPIWVYSELADNGTLGAEAQTKYRLQEVSGNGNIILGGRTELYVSLIAIKDSPFLGHGSWAQDNYYNQLLRHRLIEAGVKSQEVRFNRGNYIPSHSYLFGSWVDGGALGGLFWIYMLLMAIVSIYYSLLVPGSLRPIYAYMVLSFAWSVLFSPFGSPVRFTVSFQIVMIYYVITEAKAYLAQQRAARLSAAASVQHRLAGAHG
ncbi:hypothetical protein ACOYW6_08045 [Parablastomonas sp. CN1-191]|uniref:hypothetical protein n=1 Tax=Parablastomonas sp. CN1-191 TaxID=3400908 RepID=UPI003BF7A58F